MKDKIEIDGTTYVRDGLQTSPGPWKLFVVDNGWIFVAKDGGLNERGGRDLVDPWVVRRWEGAGIYTLVSNPDDVTYDRCPGSVSVDPGRVTFVLDLPESYAGPKG